MRLNSTLRAVVLYHGNLNNDLFPVIKAQSLTAAFAADFSTHLLYLYILLPLNKIERRYPASAL